jgi:RiboL-PSP-HEPN
MQAAIDHFRLNLSHVRNLSQVHAAALRSSPGLDTSDVFRAQVVLVVGALDHYVHEVSRLGALEVFSGKRARTAAFDRARVSLEGVLEGLKNPGSASWLDEEIRQDHGWQSFQTAEKIADAVRIFSNVQLWKRVAKNLGLDPEILKNQFKLTIDRRNKIAHEADMDPSYPGVRWPIDEILATATISFIEKLGEAIHKVIV